MLIMEYSEKTYQEILSMYKHGFFPRKNTNKEEVCTIQINECKKMVCYIALQTGLIILWILLLGGAFFLVVLDEYAECNIKVLFLIYILGSLWYTSKYLKRVHVNENGIIYRDKFFRKRFWTWAEIYECAVVRNYYIANMREYEERYIYFTKKPFTYKKKRNESIVPQYFKMKDIIMVRYSEELYWYLKQLGVLRIKKQ